MIIKNLDSSDAHLFLHLTALYTICVIFWEMFPNFNILAPTSAQPSLLPPPATPSSRKLKIELVWNSALVQMWWRITWKNEAEYLLFFVTLAFFGLLLHCRKDPIVLKDRIKMWKYSVQSTMYVRILYVKYIWNIHYILATKATLFYLCTKEVSPQN